VELDPPKLYRDPIGVAETQEIPTGGRQHGDADRARFAGDGLAVECRHTDAEAIDVRQWGADVPQNRNSWLTVVGVVADVADNGLGSEPDLHAYEPFSQFPDEVLNNVAGLVSFGRHVKLAIRTTADPRALVASVRGAIAGIDRQLALQSVETMEDRLGASVAPRRFSVVTLGAFAMGALLLAAIGLYGLLAFSVAVRRREIALRVALGAEPPAILRMVVGRGLKLVVLGLTVGALASSGVTRVLTSLLYQTDTHDAVTFAVVPVGCC
jgi:putative ABC transport system permease protein